MLRFVVFKGTAGFGDRLQCLLQCFAYAKATQRRMVVDWSDHDWSLSPQEAFDQYFEIKDLPNVGSSEFNVSAFMAWYHNTHPTPNTHPPIWQHHMPGPTPKDWLYKDLFTSTKHGERFDEIAQFKASDFEEPVVVYCGTGFRRYAYSDFKHLLPRPWLAQVFHNTFTEHQLQHKGYVVVHLRGGSKSWAGGKVPLKSLAKTLDEAFPDLGTYLNEVWAKFQQLSKTDQALPVVIISDNAWLAHEFTTRFGIGTHLSNSLDTLTIGSGIHEASANHLQKANTSRFQVNLEALRDFAIMMNAKHVIGDGHSLFSKMAAQVAPHASARWFGQLGNEG